MSSIVVKFPGVSNSGVEFLPQNFQLQLGDNPKFHFDRYQLFIVKLVESKVMNMNQSFMEPIE